KIVFNQNLVNAPVKWDEATSSIILTGHYFNLPAFLGTMILTILLCFGIKEASNVIKIFVGVKIVVILMFIFGGIKYTNSENLTKDFMPFGFQGTFKGAITVFFAYIGFDAVSTTAQEAKNPQKDLPIGILGSLGICTVLYVA
ncbi:hypothetical protein HDV05_003008, partial [Chytridiales sp. JEL 0842]